MSTPMPVVNSVPEQQSAVVVTVPQQATSKPPSQAHKKTIRGLAVSCICYWLSW